MVEPEFTASAAGLPSVPLQACLPLLPGAPGAPRAPREQGAAFKLFPEQTAQLCSGSFVSQPHRVLGQQRWGPCTVTVTGTGHRGGFIGQKQAPRSQVGRARDGEMGELNPLDTQNQQIEALQLRTRSPAPALTWKRCIPRQHALASALVACSNSVGAAIAHCP